MEVLKIRHELYFYRAQVVKALAHPLRLEIIDLLSTAAEKCVCELEKELACDQSTVSKHLALLKNVGLITSRKEGTKMLYQLRTPCIVNMFACIDRVLKKDLEIKQQKLAALVMPEDEAEK